MGGTADAKEDDKAVAIVVLLDQAISGAGSRDRLNTPLFGRGLSSPRNLGIEPRHLHLGSSDVSTVMVLDLQAGVSPWAVWILGIFPLALPKHLPSALSPV